MRRYSFVCLVLILLTANAARAQRQSALVAPQATDAGITTNLNSHFVSINRGVPAKNQLFVFLPGTGGIPINTREINWTAADMGFHAINLTYPNDEAVGDLCAPTPDLDCYANVRLEIKDGTDRSALVAVNRSNSIENRLIKLLIYLRDQAPGDNWGQFLVNDTSVNWSKVVISGHSQGGGHAGIIGRYHAVARVVMFAAMDFNGRANALANWIGQPNTTPNASTADKFWGFSHTRDETINFTRLTTAAWPAYGMPQFGPVVNVDTQPPPFQNTHSLTTDAECENAHGCVVVDARLARLDDGTPVYKPVWQYLLSNTVGVSISGRTLNPSGAALRNATVTLTDATGTRRTATTSSFGIFAFENVGPAQTYTISVTSKRYRFTPVVLTPNGNVSNIDLVGLE